MPTKVPLGVHRTAFGLDEAEIMNSQIFTLGCKIFRTVHAVCYFLCASFVNQIVRFWAGSAYHAAFGVETLAHLNAPCGHQHCTIHVDMH